MQHLAQTARLLAGDPVLLLLWLWVFITFVALGGFYAVQFSFLVGELGFAQVLPRDPKLNVPAWV